MGRAFMDQSNGDGRDEVQLKNCGMVYVGDSEE